MPFDPNQPLVTPIDDPELPPPPAPPINPLGFSPGTNPNDPPVSTAPMVPFPGAQVDTGAPINPSVDTTGPSQLNGLEGQPAARPGVAAPGAVPPLAAPTSNTLTETKSSQDKYDPTKEKGLNDAVDAEIAKSKAVADLEAAEATRKGLDEVDRANQIQKNIDADNAIKADEAAQLQKKQAEIDGAVNEYTNMKLDPNRIWSNASTGDRLLAGFAMALGAVGQAGAGGPNMAIEAMDKAINRDIDAQKVNMDKAGKNVELKRTMYQDLRQKFGDDTIARQAVREMTFNKLAADSTAKGLAAQNPIIKANADAAAAALQVKAQEAALIRSKRTEEVMKKQVPIKSPFKPGDRVLQKGETDELSPLENNVRTFSALNDMIEKFDEKQMGPFQNWWNQFKTSWGADVDPKIVEAAQAGNLAAKAYLFSISGQGVPVKEYENTLKTIMPSMGQSKQVAMTRSRDMAEQSYKTWKEAANKTIVNIPGDPRAQATVMSRDPGHFMTWRVKEQHRSKPTK